MRYSTGPARGGVLELVLEPGAGPDVEASAEASVTATLVVSPLAGAESSPRDTAAAKTTPSIARPRARNFGHAGVEQHERPVVGREAIQPARRFGAGEHPARRVARERHDVRRGGL